MSIDILMYNQLRLGDMENVSTNNQMRKNNLTFCNSPGKVLGKIDLSKEYIGKTPKGTHHLVCGPIDFLS